MPFGPFSKIIFGTCDENNTANSGLYMGYVKYLKIVINQANEMGIPDAEERLQWVRWKEQKHKSGLRDVGRQNGIFHQEHIVPVSQIAKELFALEKITIKNNKEKTNGRSF